MDRTTDRLFHCCLDILNDRCPSDRKEYLCMKSEEFDETACTRCWSLFLFRVLNNQA